VLYRRDGRAAQGREAQGRGRLGQVDALDKSSNRTEAAAAEAGRPLGERMISLDVLRALAVFLVLGRHAKLPAQGWGGATGRVMEIWTRGGWVGVDLFFVLSGFLVSGLLFKEYRRSRDLRPGRFFIRRGMKIYPAFYFFLAATTLQTVIRKGFGALPLPALVSEALFIQNYGPSIFPHTWSLAVEEHFYILCALLLYFLVRRGQKISPQVEDPFRVIPAIFCVVAVVSLALRLSVSLKLSYDHRTHLFPTHLRLDSLMFGVLLSYGYNLRRSAVERIVRGREVGLVVLGLSLLAPAFILPLESTFFIHTVGISALYLGSGMIVISLVVRPLPHTAIIRTIGYVGTFSYSIYLWHLAVQSWLEHAFGFLGLATTSPQFLQAYLLCSVVIGSLMAKLVEIPFLSLRNRLFPATAG
jgi:peptidoglycan/LPS O-acetylase OafA/YrhL